MEHKESTESGSPGGDSEFDSLPSSENGGAGGGGMVPGTVNMESNINMAKNAAVTSSPAAAVGGGIIAGGGVMTGASSELMMGKKKRGRPRKYDAAGNLTPGYLKSPPAAAAQTPSQSGFTLSTSPSYKHKSAPKRGRGRSSAGSGNWKSLASLGELFLHTAGGDFTPHVATVYSGEDIAGKILTFAQKGSRGVCVLSANGSISNVTIRQPGSAGGLMTYEGRFEILTLTGSYTVSDNGGIRSRSGGLSVSLASPDGRIIGGCVAGMLMAASPIQIVVGSFEANGFKRKDNSEAKVTSPFQFAPATVTAAIPLSQAAPASNGYPIPTSHFQVQSPGEAQPNSADWNHSTDHRPSPDVNISLPLVEH